jgi:threonine aldolase
MQGRERKLISIVKAETTAMNGQNMIIELRSDTFTLPTQEMLAAIARAKLGNDGYGEDPTVRELEDLAALKLGKEAACLMPSGTMANLASVSAYCQGKKGIVLVGDKSDIYVYESDGSVLCPAITYVPIGTEDDGTLRTGDLERAFRKYHSRIALVCLENPHNLCGGVILPPNHLQDIAMLVHARGASVHLDGARIFNAAIASRTNPARLVEFADSIQFCLSKGLSAPVGSMVAGSIRFITRVREIRKIVGGTMRQAGIIAAPGIVALQQMVDRLEEDHLNARRFAEGLSAIPGIYINLNTVQTNTVVFQVAQNRFMSEGFVTAAGEYGIHLSEFEYGRIRAVIHRNITPIHIEKALEGIARLLATESIGSATTSV